MTESNNETQSSHQHSSPTEPAPQQNRKWIMIALMMSTALAALDVTIVSTAMPTIVAQLSGVTLYSWLVSIYLLTSTTSVPLYGQLADNLGRKPILLFGITLFTLASILCSQANTMTQLIVYRGLQGLGSGAILPMTMTIIGDLFGVEERAKYQGIFSGVWGVSSILGPALGALILTVWNWHGIFLINLPVGIAAFLLVLKVYHEHNVSKHRSVDVVGALLMTIGVAALMVAVQRKSTESGVMMTLFSAALVCFLSLAFVERKVKSPFLPIDLLKRPLVYSTYLIAFFGGVVQFGTSAFMPLFVQGGMGGTPMHVGLTMLPVAIGWPIGSVLSGKWILKMGYKKVLAIGMAISVVATGLLQLLNESSSLIFVMSIVAGSGLSMGLTATPLIIAIQNAVEWKQRGIATALNQFSRTIGGVIGVAIMGAALNVKLGKFLEGSSTTAGVKPETLVNDLLDPAKRSHYGADILAVVQKDIAGALHSSYLVPVLASAIALTLIFVLYPHEKIKTSSKQQDHTTNPA